MIIDSHVHIGKDIFGIKNGILNFNGTLQKQNIKEYVFKMNKLRISKAIIFPFPSPLCQFGKDDFWYHKENNKLFNDAQRYENRLYFIPAFNPLDKKSIDYALELINKYNLRGLKLHTRTVQYEPKKLDQKILKTLENNDIPLVLHIGSDKEAELIEKNISISLEPALKLAKENKNVRFVFAHLGRLHKKLEEALNLDNVMLDTSGLSIKEVWKDYHAKLFDEKLINKSPVEIISTLVEDGFEDKIIWGSDEPYGLSYKNELDYINNSNISRSAKDKILRKNSINWYKL